MPRRIKSAARVKADKEKKEQEKVAQQNADNEALAKVKAEDSKTADNSVATQPVVSEDANPENNNTGGYTMNDVASVAETGSLPPTEPKSAYDMYMEEAKNIYNQGVEQNNKSAANQAASAGAEYRELNRNVGEINKANGRANTGYAGDTSIDAYNAYRNSVNESYSNADKANNDLYSYYLSKMTKLQQAKDTKEATDRQLDFQEKQYEDQRASETADNIETLKGENAYDAQGYITSETAERLWKYVKGVYGDDIPDSVMANLNSEKGFSEWLAEYNGGESGEQGFGAYDLRYELYGIEDSDNWGASYEEKKEKLELLKGKIPEEQYAELEKQLGEYAPTSATAEWSIQGLGSGRVNDDVDITINGVTYDLLCGGTVDSETKYKLNKLATGDYEKTPSNGGDSWLGNWGGVNSNRQPGKLVVMDNKMYLYTNKGWVSVVNDNDAVSLQNCINAYLKNSKSK